MNYTFYLLLFAILLCSCSRSLNSDISLKAYNQINSSNFTEEEFLTLIDTSKYFIRNEKINFSIDDKEKAEGLIETIIYDFTTRSETDTSNFSFSFYYYTFDSWKNATKWYSNLFKRIKTKKHLQLSLKEYYFIKENIVFVLATDKSTTNNFLDNLLVELYHHLLGKNNLPQENSIIKSYDPAKYELI